MPSLTCFSNVTEELFTKLFFLNIQFHVKCGNIFKASKLSFPEFCIRISCKALGPDSIVLLKHEEALGRVDWLF